MSTTREKAPSILTEVGARRLTARIRDALALADDLLVQAYEGRIWEVCSPPLPDFRTYCEVHLPEMQLLKLRTGPRRERVQKLLEAGASIREAAAAAGTSVGSAHNDAKVLGFVQERSELNTPAPAESPVPAPPVYSSTADRAVALVAAQGARGMTVKELGCETGWHHGQSSGALSRAHRKLGRIRPTGEFRDRCGIYVAS